MSIRARRGTSAQVSSAASTSGLLAGELIYITNTGEVAYATAANTYVIVGRASDIATKADAAATTAALAAKLESVAYANILTEALASQSEVRSNAANKLLAVQPALASLDWVNLADATTITFDMAEGVNRKVTLGGNRTLGQIANPIPGMTFAIEVSQPGSSSTRTLSYHSSFVTPSAGITIKTGNNVKTLLVGQVLAASGGLATKAFIAAAGDGWTA